MSLQKKKLVRKTKRAFRVRNKLANKSQRLRVSVFRSAKHIYAQIIDDAAHKTVASYSSLNITNQSGDKKEVARTVGLELAKLAVSKGIDSVFFDRGSFLYHGRVAAMGDGLREGGLNF